MSLHPFNLERDLDQARTFLFKPIAVYCSRIGRKPIRNTLGKLAREGETYYHELEKYSRNYTRKLMRRIKRL